jgi:glucan phosphoethanolaminetransferase (alkaline phosphatase superfamily)
MKRTFGRIFALLYIAIVLVCITFVIKPGASIFYFKHTIGNQELVPDVGFAYRYKLELNPIFLRTHGILVYENGEQLIPSQGNIVIDEGKNTFSISETSPGAGYLYLSSSDNSNPITNDRKYTLYFPLRFVSRRLGILYLAILLPFLAWFLLFAFTIPNHRRMLLRSPKGIVLVWDHFFKHITGFIRPGNGSTSQQIKARASYWKKLFTITILVAYFYIFMEWIFLATMPSFMSVLSIPKKLEILLLSGLGLALICSVVVTVFILLDIFAIVAHFSRFTTYLGLVIPTIILSALSLLLIDNFTYTLFKFGISSTTGVLRAVYGLLFIAITAYIFFQMQKVFGLRGKTNTKENSNNRLFFVALSLLSISIVLALINFNFNISKSIGTQANIQEPTRLPNIILLGSDGMNANNFSVYGYTHDTTPRLRELAQSSLVMENAFTNSGNTAGSVISIMTGKLPTQTRVLYPPDILTGLDSFQHLPGILKSLGYKTIELGVQYYVDAYSYNLQDGFDMVNNRTRSGGKLIVLGQKLGYENPTIFMNKIFERISERILHIFYIRNMENPYRIVTEPVPTINDKEKINQLLDLLDQSQVPLFAHLHLMGTHGATFSPARQVFSKGETQSEPWMVDFYDDTILTFDDYVGKVIDTLKANGQYDNTILIIYTDHNQKWQVNEPIPLIIHFPVAEKAERIYKNTQNIDIPPTIMDYLGLPKPDWMSGESLLNDSPDNSRLIFSMGTTEVTMGEHDVFVLDPERIKPPFYQFTYINIKDCQKWYTFNLKTYTWSSGEVAGYTEPCDESSLHSFDEIKQALIQRLSMDGFDTSSLLK